MLSGAEWKAAVLVQRFDGQHSPSLYRTRTSQPILQLFLGIQVGSDCFVVDEALLDGNFPKQAIIPVLLKLQDLVYLFGRHSPNSYQGFADSLFHAIISLFVVLLS